MYLIWRRDATAKGAKKNTSSNVICLQYILCNKINQIISRIYVFDKFELLASFWLQAKKDYSTQEFEQWIERLRSAMFTGIKGITEISCVLN